MNTPQWVIDIESRERKSFKLVLKELYAKTTNSREIGRQLGIDGMVVYYWLNKYGIWVKDTDKGGPKSEYGKKVALVKQIRKEYHARVTVTSLANKYDIPRGTIEDWIYYNTMADV